MVDQLIGQLSITRAANTTRQQNMYYNQNIARRHAYVENEAKMSILGGVVQAMLFREKHKKHR